MDHPSVHRLCCASRNDQVLFRRESFLDHLGHVLTWGSMKSWLVHTNIPTTHCTTTTYNNPDNPPRGQTERFFPTSQLSTIYRCRPTRKYPENTLTHCHACACDANRPLFRNKHSLCVLLTWDVADIVLTQTQTTRTDDSKEKRHAGRTAQPARSPPLW